MPPSSKPRPREAHEKKQSCKGRKTLRRQPDNPYGELKQNITCSLTPTAIAALKALCQAMGISRSELFERIAREQIRIDDRVHSNSTLPDSDSNEIERASPSADLEKSEEQPLEIGSSLALVHTHELVEQELDETADNPDSTN